jgi:hypothetical protein
MGQWGFNLTDSMEAEVQETMQRTDTLGWMVPDNNPSTEWSMKAPYKPVLAMATTSRGPGIAEDVVEKPGRPLLQDIDGHGLDPVEAAIVDGVVHNVVDVALGGTTGQSVTDAQ